MTYNGVNFNGSTYTCTDFKIWCNFADGNTFWLANRLLVLVQSLSTKDVTISVTNPGITAQYAPDANGYAIVDLTEVARAYTSPATVIKTKDSTYSYTVFSNMTYRYLIDPASVLKPYVDAMASDATLAPPKKLIAPLSGLPLQCELHHPAADDWYVISLPDRSSTVITGKTFAVPATLTRFIIYTDSYSSNDFYRRLTPQLCDRMYASVRWRAFTGITRLHVFEVVKHTTGTADQYALLRLDNAPETIKGRKEELTLRIDGLDAYGVWYYGDVATSSMVEVSLDGSTWQRVQIGTNSVQVPDGDAENGKVELKTTYKTYDAVAL